MKNIFKPTIGRIIVGILAIGFFAGSFALARFLTVTMKAVEGIPGVGIDSGSGATAIPVPGLPTEAPAAPAVALPPTWDGASRVTILLLGVDSQPNVGADGKISPDRTGPARSDTMILLTIDPISKTAGMLSIPRDLWVNIPGFNFAKINTAYYNGEAYKIPGGGPELAMRTVEQVIGVPVQYYAQVQFWSFTQLIDDIGKIQVDVPQKIIIDPVGPGSDKIMLSKGLHMLGGVEALGYVRQRHTADGDVDRSRRQQAVIMAVRDKVLSPANFPTLLAQAPAIYNEIQSGIRTNLTFDEIMRLGMLARSIPPENIKRGVIDYSMVQLDSLVVNGQAQSILKPIPDKIRELRDEIFSVNGAVSPLAQGDSLSLAKEEGATLRILNGSSISGLAQRTSDYLTSLGFTVLSTDPANYFPGITQMIIHRSRLYATKFLADLFALKPGVQIAYKLDPAAKADIDILVADDWAARIPVK